MLVVCKTHVYIRNKSGNKKIVSVLKGYIDLNHGF